MFCESAELVLLILCCLLTAQKKTNWIKSNSLSKSKVLKNFNIEIMFKSCIYTKMNYTVSNYLALHLTYASS